MRTKFAIVAVKNKKSEQSKQHWGPGKVAGHRSLAVPIFSLVTFSPVEKISVVNFIS